jgi:predicted transposase/invertase (TIGR01784 family)
MRPLGIRPVVDFVFKMLFATPDNIDLLIDLLNAVLVLNSPITEVEILNPFNNKEFEEDKLSIVDIKARDQDGSWYIIEMQTSLPAGLQNRLVYYTAEMYAKQMREGEGYGDLKPAISICFLTEPLFPHHAAGHFRFSLVDVENRISLNNQFQLHVIELSKYDCLEEIVHGASRLEQWTFFLHRADEFPAERLRELLPTSTFTKATGMLEMISHDDRLRIIYDDHAKAERDQFALIKDARSEGEARGIEKGEWIGRVRILKQLLNDTITGEERIRDLSIEELTSLANELQERLQGRS